MASRSSARPKSGVRKTGGFPRKAEGAGGAFSRCPLPGREGDPSGVERGEPGSGDVIGDASLSSKSEDEYERGMPEMSLLACCLAKGSALLFDERQQYLAACGKA